MPSAFRNAGSSRRIHDGIDHEGIIILRIPERDAAHHRGVPEYAMTSTSRPLFVSVRRVPSSASAQPEGSAARMASAGQSAS